MANAKKKTSVKRAAKTAAKPQSKAASAAGAVAKSAAAQHGEWARKGAEFARRNASEWQKGANEWAKQSARLYQFPFAGGDVNEATRQAAATVQSATENMVRAGSDMMHQLFGGQDPMAQWSGVVEQAKNSLPGADMASEKMRSFARESSEQLNRATAGCQRAAGEAMELSRENAEAMVECCNVAINVSKEIGAELITYANKSFAQNVELSKQLLNCRTLNDMFDLSTKFMKTNLDGFFSESVRLSEKLFQCATDVSEPLNERISDTNHRLSKAIVS